MRPFPLFLSNNMYYKIGITKSHLNSITVDSFITENSLSLMLEWHNKSSQNKKEIILLLLVDCCWGFSMVKQVLLYIWTAEEKKNV